MAVTKRPLRKRKTERVVARASAEQKSLIERAANLQGVTMSDFLIASAYREATRTIERHEVLELGRAAGELFVATLLEPPPANEALGEAKRLHDQLVK